MRIFTLGLIMTCVACAQAPQPIPRKPVSAPAQTATTQTSTSSTDSIKNEATPVPAAVDEQIQAADVAAVMETAPAAQAPMDMAAMEQQVAAVFAQSQLSPEQNAAMSQTSMELIAAANAGDQEAVTELSNKLAKQAIAGKGLLGGFGGFGLVDVAGIVAAVMDLIAAAANADVAGIIDALMDLVAALGA